MDPAEYSRTLYNQNLELREYIENAKTQYEATIANLTKERDESMKDAVNHYEYGKLCKEELEESKKLVERLQKRNARLRDSVKGIKVEVEDPETEQVEAGTEEQDSSRVDYKKKIADLENSVAERDEKIRDLETKNHQLSEEMAKLTAARVELKLQNNETMKSFAQLEAESSKLKTAVSQNEQLISLGKSYVESMERKLGDQKNAFDGKTNDYEKKLAELKREVEMKDEEIGNLKTNNRQLLEDMTKLTAAHDELKLQNDETMKSVAQLEAESSKLKTTVSQNEKLISLGKSYVESMERKLGDQKIAFDGKINDYEKKLAELKREVEMQTEEIGNLNSTNRQLSTDVQRLTANDNWNQNERERARALSSQNFQMSMDLANLKPKIVELENKLAESERDNKTLIEMKSSLMQGISQSGKNYDAEREKGALEWKDLLARLVQLTAQHKELEEKHESAQTVQKEMQAQLTKLGEEKMKLEEKFQKDMEQLKEDHAMEIQGLKARYVEMERENEMYSKVCEGLKAVKGSRKRCHGDEQGPSVSKWPNPDGDEI